MKRLEARKFDRKLNKIGGEEGRPAHVKSPVPKLDPTPKNKARKGPTGAKPVRNIGVGEEIDMKELMKFIMENYNQPDKFKDHPQSQEILDVVGHLLAISMGGWSEGDGVYINESNRCASMENWELVGDKLVHRERNAILDEKDWIHDIRSAILEGAKK